MSGLANPSYHEGPRELYAAMRSSPRLTVSNVRTEPTEMPDGALPGDAMPAYPIWPGRSVAAEVAGRDDDDDAGARSVLDGLHEGIGRGRLENRMAERQIDDVNLEHVLVAMANSMARITLSVVPWPCAFENLQADQARGRCNTHVAARGEARDVRAVTVRVRWRRPGECRRA